MNTTGKTKKCSVVNCRNNNKNSLCEFYTFSSASGKIIQREKWISAVNRKNVDGSPWTPRRWNLICSAHFIGGRKSDDPANPSYVPTIFPEVYQKNRYESVLVTRPGFHTTTDVTFQTDETVKTEQPQFEDGKCLDHLKLQDVSEDTKAGIELEGKFYQTTEVNLQTDGTVKMEETQIENPEDKNSWYHLKLQEMSDDAKVDIKLEGEFYQSTDVKFQTEKTVEAAESQIEMPEHEKSWDPEKLQQMPDVANIDIKMEADFRSLDYKVELSEINKKSEIDAVEVAGEDEEKIDYNMVETEIGRGEFGKMFECKECQYKCRYKSKLKEHMMIHKDLTEMEMFKCNRCDYQSKRKGDLVKHKHKHKDAPEVFKCKECCFETKYRRTLRLHMPVHSDPLQIEIFKCSNCDFQTKWKEHLQKHLRLHKDRSQFELFRCQECSFESRHKSSLQKHMLLHSDPSQGKMYECQQCDYTCHQKGNLTRHMLVHRPDSLLIKIFRCSHCSFETKHKESHTRHTLVHKDLSQAQGFRCTECSFETKYRQSFKRHTRQMHKDLINNN